MPEKIYNTELICTKSVADPCFAFHSPYDVDILTKHVKIETLWTMLFANDDTVMDYRGIDNTQNKRHIIVTAVFKKMTGFPMYY